MDGSPIRTSPEVPSPLSFSPELLRPVSRLSLRTPADDTRAPSQNPSAQKSNGEFDDGKVGLSRCRAEEEGTRPNHLEGFRQPGVPQVARHEYNTPTGSDVVGPTCRSTVRGGTKERPDRPSGPCL